MSGKPRSLILDSTETDATVTPKIDTWLKEIGEDNYLLVPNLVDFWRRNKVKCDTLELKKEENYFTATLWKIAAEYNTVDLSELSPKWNDGKLPKWRDPSL